MDQHSRPGADLAPRTFVDVVRAQAAQRPDKIAFTFLRDGETPDGALTYAQLDARARTIAAALAAQTRPGARALLLFQNGLDFIAAFLGCLYAGVVAVPVYPPLSRREYWLRLETIARDCSAVQVIGTGEYLDEMQRHIDDLPTLGACARLAVDAPEQSDGDGFVPCPGPLAFLQYTSGSTSTPKGVRVTHANLLHNMELMRQGFGHDADAVLVSWLPLFHDMGLIGNVLQSVYCGASCSIMTPAAFLQKPIRWLQAISRWRATSSFAPNFAYELCARRGTEQELRELDLSCWSMALNGAEPVRPESLAAFAQRYAPCGFDARAFYPGYGLAEAAPASVISMSTPRALTVKASRPRRRRARRRGGWSPPARPGSAPTC
jgi:acyl-CoA synthetase (AMP-forming)/AMP-acid ligase II